MVNSMEKCNVCDCVIVGNGGVFISSLIKGVYVFGCQDCQNNVIRNELIRKVEAINEKFQYKNWFRYKQKNQFKEGHGFIFSNGDVITVCHELGDVGLNKLLEYIKSTKFNYDVTIDNEHRAEYYAKQGVMYPSDPFSAETWW